MLEEIARVLKGFKSKKLIKYNLITLIRYSRKSAEILGPSQVRLIFSNVMAQRSSLK